jgi:hypothetical protein
MVVVLQCFLERRVKISEKGGRNTRDEDSEITTYILSAGEGHTMPYAPGE